MYPFRSALRWHIAGRTRHLLRILRETPLPPELAHHPGALRRWARARTVLLGILALGLVTTLLAIAASYLPALADASDALRPLAAWSSAFSGLLTAAVLWANRTLGLLELDVLATLSLHRLQRH